MPNTCKYEGCTCNVFSKGYCRTHWGMFHAKPIKKNVNNSFNKPRNRIKPVADKRRSEKEEYKVLRDQFLKDHPVCEIPIEGCKIKSTQVHHAEGREGTRFLDTSTWKAACAGPCHDEATEHSREAIDRGYSKSRCGPVKRNIFYKPPDK